MSWWRFFQSETLIGHAAAGHFRPALVLVSIAMAGLAAFAALAVVERVQACRSPLLRRAWLGVGGGVLGGGIWAMHFTGMLAFTLPFPVRYSPGWTVVSLVPAFLGAVASLRFIARADLGWRGLQAAALLLAAGIGAMHYTGMEAIRTAATLWYDPWLFGLSVVITHLLATGALLVQRVGSRIRPQVLGSVLSAMLIAVAVSGMHYTAMAAARFVPTGEPVPDGYWMAPGLLTAMIGGLATLAMIITVIATHADRRIRQALGEVAENDQRHREVITAMGAGLLSLGPDGRIEATNTVADRLLDYPEGALIGTPAAELLAMDGGVTPAGLLRSGPAVARTADGRFVPVELLLTAFGPPGRTRTELLVHDVSERRQLEVQMRQVHKLEAIGQLAAGIAHEINTPIQYVGDNTRFLQSAVRDLEPVVAQMMALKQAAQARADLRGQCDAIDAAMKAADAALLVSDVPGAIEQTLEGVDRVARIVRAMKEFSHPATEKTPIDLNQAIQSTIIVATSEWKHHAELTTDLDPGLPFVPCVPGEINQVVLNLIINAAQAIADHRPAKGGLGSIRVTTGLDDGQVVIRVQDTGPGIPESIRDRIFDPFFTTKEVGRGTGQGLSLAHSLVVRRHGGRIGFETELGKGTTFEVRLPLRERVEAA